MVSRFDPSRALNLAGRLQSFLDTRAKAAGKPLSLREIERLTGIPHQRLSDFLRAPERRTAATISAIEKGLARPALQFQVQRERTLRIDAPLFTAESLRGLSRPDVATGFQFVYNSESYGSGFGQTVLSDMAMDNPEDAIGLVPGGVDNIVSVIWYTPQRA